MDSCPDRSRPDSHPPVPHTRPAGYTEAWAGSCTRRGLRDLSPPPPHCAHPLGRMPYRPAAHPCIHLVVPLVSQMAAWAPSLLWFGPLPSPYTSTELVSFRDSNVHVNIFVQANWLSHTPLLQAAPSFMTMLASLCSLIILSSSIKTGPTVIFPLKSKNHMFVLCLLLYLPFIILKASSQT